MSDQTENSAPVRVPVAPDNENIPQLHPGDSVNVHVRIKEGERERIQEFRGTVIRIRNGGNSANFTVRRVASHGIGVERTFLIRSPVAGQGRDRAQRSGTPRSALLFRDRTGKRARLKEKRQT